jgi:2'-5' RNA ligase
MRLFLAIDLPEALRDEIAHRIEGLRNDLAGWRWLRPSSIHLTLRFLGEVGAEQDASWRSEWRRVVSGRACVRFEVRGTGVFPGPRNARVLWLGIEEIGSSGRLAALAAALEDAARGLGLPPETRGFRPHLTIARAAGRRRAAAPAADLDVGFPEVTARSVVLFRSELGATGARYTALEEFPLTVSDIVGT